MHETYATNACLIVLVVVVTIPAVASSAWTLIASSTGCGNFATILITSKWKATLDPCGQECVSESDCVGFGYCDNCWADSVNCWLWNGACQQSTWSGFKDYYQYVLPTTVTTVTSTSTNATTTSNTSTTTNTTDFTKTTSSPSTNRSSTTNVTSTFAPLVVSINDSTTTNESSTVGSSLAWEPANKSTTTNLTLTIGFSTRSANKSTTTNLTSTTTSLTTSTTTSTIANHTASTNTSTTINFTNAIRSSLVFASVNKSTTTNVTSHLRLPASTSMNTTANVTSTIRSASALSLVNKSTTTNVTTQYKFSTTTNISTTTNATTHLKFSTTTTNSTNQRYIATPPTPTPTPSPTPITPTPTPSPTPITPIPAPSPTPITPTPTPSPTRITPTPAPTPTSTVSTTHFSTVTSSAATTTTTTTTTNHISTTSTIIASATSLSTMSSSTSPRFIATPTPSPTPVSPSPSPSPSPIASTFTSSRLLTTTTMTVFIITMTLTIRHGSYDEVMKDSVLRERLITSIIESYMSNLVGYARSDFIVSFQRGSIRAIVQIRAKDASTQAQLQDAQQTIEAHVLTKTKKLVDEFPMLLEYGKTLDDMAVTSILGLAPNVTFTTTTKQMFSGIAPSDSDESATLFFVVGAIIVGCIGALLICWYSNCARRHRKWQEAKKLSETSSAQKDYDDERPLSLPEERKSRALVNATLVDTSPAPPDDLNKSKASVASSVNEVFLTMETEIEDFAERDPWQMNLLATLEEVPKASRRYQLQL